MSFWKVGYKLLQGKFLGFMSGEKHDGRPVARGGQGGQLTPPPLRTKGPLFGTSRVKLLRPITING